jgi:hypothetical protein
VRSPDLDDQHQSREGERERDPDAAADVLAVHEARPERDEDRADELDHERDADLDAVNREEVRPLHERQAADAERDEEQELVLPDAERAGPSHSCNERQADQCTGAPHFGQPLRVDAGAEDDLRDGAVDGEERCRDGHHPVAEHGFRLVRLAAQGNDGLDHRANLTDRRFSVVRFVVYIDDMKTCGRCGERKTTTAPLQPPRSSLGDRQV